MSYSKFIEYRLRFINKAIFFKTPTFLHIFLFFNIFILQNIQAQQSVAIVTGTGVPVSGLNNWYSAAPILGLQYIIHNNVNREYLIYIPKSYDESKQHPLLFNFHGGGGTATDHLQYADMRKLAEDNKFILVYPQGSRIDGKEVEEGKGGKVKGTHWNPDLPSVLHNKSKADDYGFLESMMAKIDSDYSLSLIHI